MNIITLLLVIITNVVFFTKDASRGVGHGHVHHRNNCIFVKIFHMIPLVAVQKIRRWGSMGIGRYFSSTL